MKLRIAVLATLVLTVVGASVVLYRQRLLSLPSAPVKIPTTVEKPATAAKAPAVVEKPAPAPTPPADSAGEQMAMLGPLIPPEIKPPLLPRSAAGVADRVLVEKKAHRLTLFRHDVPLKSYAIALGQQPEGPKRFAGDNKTPEGRYVIDSRKKNSAYHRSLHISYPRPEDVAFAVERKRSAGGDIMIHGLPNGQGYWGARHLLRDWTAGCIAVTNAEIEELWRAIPDGTPIEIRP